MWRSSSGGLERRKPRLKFDCGELARSCPLRRDSPPNRVSPVIAISGGGWTPASEVLVRVGELGVFARRSRSPSTREGSRTWYCILKRSFGDEQRGGHRRPQPSQRRWYNMSPPRAWATPDGHLLASGEGTRRLLEPLAVSGRLASSRPEAELLHASNNSSFVRPFFSFCVLPRAPSRLVRICDEPTRHIDRRVRIRRGSSTRRRGGRGHR